MPSRMVVFFDDLNEEELQHSGITVSTLARIGRIATIPRAFVMTSAVFDEFRTESSPEKMLPWSVELEIAKAFDRLGSPVANLLPSPSYPSEISGSYVSDKTSLVTEIRKTMLDFLSEEEEDYRKGKEVGAYDLAFLVQEIPPHMASGSVARAEKGYDARALLGLPVDLSSSDHLTLTSEGEIIDKTIYSQDTKWVAGDVLDEVGVDEGLSREIKVPADLMKKLSELGARMTSKIGNGTYYWYLKDRIFIVWNVELREEALPTPSVIGREVPERRMPFRKRD